MLNQCATLNTSVTGGRDVHETVEVELQHGPVSFHLVPRMFSMTTNGAHFNCLVRHKN